MARSVVAFRGPTIPTDWRAQVCPKCGASIGQRCMGKLPKLEGAYRKVLSNPHVERRRMGRRSPRPVATMPADVRAEIVEKYARNWGMEAVGRHVGWSAKSVRRVLEEAQVPIRVPGKTNGDYGRTSAFPDRSDQG